MAQIAFLIADGFEDSEFEVPYERLRAAGHQVTIVGTEAGKTVQGKRGSLVEVEAAASDVEPESFDAIVVPGGYSPDRLRLNPDAVELVRHLADDGRLVAAICHGPSLLIDADCVDGRTVTSWPSIRRDLENAGASWVDCSVVEDANVVTSRKPGDLDDFSAAILSKIAKP